MEYDIGERLKENFGVLVSGVDIGAIEIDKTSEGYRQLMAVTKGYCRNQDRKPRHGIMWAFA